MDDTKKNVEEAVRQGMAGIVFYSRELAVEKLRGLGVEA